MQYIDSKSIEAIGYDAESQELHVRFLKSGKTYVYYGVEQWVFDEFMGADSKGTYLNMNIKGAFNYGEV
ncbi:KTSC domain-containing protein [Rhodopirellula baltica]|nr:KTSC domain-containing protein [Rhodopirellula baltica]